MCYCKLLKLFCCNKIIQINTFLALKWIKSTTIRMPFVKFRHFLFIRQIYLTATKNSKSHIYTDQCDNWGWAGLKSTFCIKSNWLNDKKTHFVNQITIYYIATVSAARFHKVDNSIQRHIYQFTRKGEM